MKASKPEVVGALTLRTRNVSLFQEYVARTGAFYTVQVRPRVSGELAGFNFTDGQPVRKGRVLFWIDSVPYQIAVQAAEAHLSHAQSDRAESQAQLNKAEADVERYIPLAKIHAIPEEDLADARAAEQVRQAQLKQAEAEVLEQQSAVTTAKLNLSYTKIYSPISGTIGQREVDPGNLVHADENTALATVSADDPVLVSFAVSDAEYLQHFAPGHNGREGGPAQYQLILADGSRYPYPGRFHAISRALNPQTDTLTVALLYANPDHVLRPGEFAQVRTNLQQQTNALLVPVTAVQTLQGTESVFVVDGHNKVSQRTIVSAARQGQDYVVKSGLAPGDRIVVEGQNKVAPGDTVRVQAVAPDGDSGSGPDLAGSQS